MQTSQIKWAIGAVPKVGRKSGLLVSQLVMAVALLGFSTSLSQASPVVIDFEGRADGETITTQVVGLTFANAAVLTAGLSLNEFEFPPRSGVNVVFDNGGPLSISFTTPALSFGGYFTYSVPITIAVFDSLNNQLTTFTSAFNNNLALTGEPGSSSNEFLTFSFSGGISRIVIIGDPSGGSFALDDFRFDAGPTAVPEPSAMLLLGFGLSAAAGWQRKRNGRKTTARLQPQPNATSNTIH